MTNREKAHYLVCCIGGSVRCVFSRDVVYMLLSYRNNDFAPGTIVSWWPFRTSNIKPLDEARLKRRNYIIAVTLSYSRMLFPDLLHTHTQ